VTNGHGSVCIKGDSAGNLWRFARKVWTPWLPCFFFAEKRVIASAQDLTGRANLLKLRDYRLIIHVDRCGARDFREARHQHDVAGKLPRTNPAPAERDASVTRKVHPVGAPRTLGSSVNEYWVLRNANREFLVTPFRELLQFCLGLIAEA